MLSCYLQPPKKLRADDPSCRSRPSSCRSNNTFTFPTNAKSPPNPKTWLLAEKASKSDFQKDNVFEHCENSETKNGSEQGNGLVTICEINGLCVNVITDQDDIRSAGTAV